MFSMNYSKLPVFYEVQAHPLVKPNEMYEVAKSGGGGQASPGIGSILPNRKMYPAMPTTR
jgi:hypothetical protein